jgi:hypothetical protein
MHIGDVHEYSYVAAVRSGFASTTPYQLYFNYALCHRDIVLRSYRLYINFAVRRDYSSPGCIGSTSTLSCTATIRHPAARALFQL